ncbi:hypothetical protein MNBD_GAMMA23-787 [hydrothermal vent metagenome]|uniref:Uncharacterized protein n=1 Tax=hydrothermal vent metagenome TaxID=652676 RepID=A0A3B1AEF0_9ZZZZ
MKWGNRSKVRVSTTLLLQWLKFNHTKIFLYISIGYIVSIGFYCLYVAAYEQKPQLKSECILAVNNIQKKSNKALVFHFKFVRSDFFGLFLMSKTAVLGVSVVYMPG